MICKHCETENPEEAVFCMHCGNRLDGKKICPSCGSMCPEEAIFCHTCGKRIIKEERTEAQPTETPKEKKSVFEKVKYAFDLSGGICLMTAVFFSFVFAFCMGLTATASTTLTSTSVSASATTMMWDYFGSAYDELKELFDNLTYYSGYYEASNYIPVVLTTVICAGTLISVLVCTVVAAVKYGKHFKNPEIKYAKPAIAAIFSFILGATAFLLVNSTSIVLYSDLRVSIRFSGATTAGIVLSALFLCFYCVSRTVVLGKEFLTKRVIANFVCTLVGILFTILVAAFAAAPSVNVNLNLNEKPSLSNFELNFFNSNLLIARIFTGNRAHEIPDGFIETYVTSALAQFVQIALLILAFVLLVKRAGGFGKDSKSCLGVTIATTALAAVYLALSCTAISFGNDLMYNYNGAEITIGAGPIVAFIASALALADAITHKVLLRKTAV